MNCEMSTAGDAEPAYSQELGVGADTTKAEVISQNIVPRNVTNEQSRVIMNP